MIDNSTIFWFFCIFFFLFLEIGHPGLLYFLSFSCGAFAALVADLFFSLSIYGQSFVFMSATCSALVCFYLLSHRYRQEIVVDHRSNVDALIGRHVILYQQVDQPARWYINIDGQIWQVRAAVDQIFFDGQLVTIIAIQGCHVRVNNFIKK